MYEFDRESFGYVFPSLFVAAMIAKVCEAIYT